jgi:hypothetical protein
MGRSRGQEAGRDQSGPGSAKVCPVCGRSFEWRRKWASTWDRIRYCSAGCRRGLRPHDRALEEAILELLGQRARGASICPSEAARLLEGEEPRWRALLEPARNAARRLARQGRIEISKGGRRIEPDDVRGPIRLRAP